MSRDQQLLNFFKQHRLEQATPGLLLRAYHKGKKCLDVEYGQVFEFYDLASLTKVIFTVTRFMMLNSDGLFDENTKVKKIIPWVSSNLSFKSLLHHRSGALAWRPYFKSMSMDLPREDRWIDLERKFRSEAFLQKLKPSPKLSDSQIFGQARESVKKCVYSDVGFLLLGVALKYLESRPLLLSWQAVQDAFDLQQTHFHLDNKPLKKKSAYAPTQFCAWRKKQCQGEVSDENAYGLGGVAPHAGLFSTIEDTSKWILKLRKIFYENKFKNMICQEILRKFVQSPGDFGLGFMRPSKMIKIKYQKAFTASNFTVPNFTVPSCGRLFSKASFGHTGFSGTSVWFDPKQDLIVILLSNRICPSTKNKKFLFLRPLIHEQIMQSLNL